MIYVNNNAKLADLLEKMLKSEKLTVIELNDVKDLIADLRSPRGEINLVEDYSCVHCDYISLNN